MYTRTACHSVSVTGHSFKNIFNHVIIRTCTNIGYYSALADDYYGNFLNRVVQYTDPRGIWKKYGHDFTQIFKF